MSIAAAQEDAPRISLEDAKKAYDDGSAFFIDSRPADGYKIEHIKGAVNITVDTLKDKLKDLPKDKTIIAYCT
jgi:rhodanese-related sulfurtransferase